MTIKYTPRTIDASLQSDLLNLSKSFHLEEHISDIYRAVDYVYAYWKYAGNPDKNFLELIELIYLLKYSDLSRGIKIAGIKKHTSITSNITNRKLIHEIVSLLQSRISEEDILFYFNHWILEETCPETDSNEHLFEALMMKKCKGEQLNIYQNKLIENYLDKQEQDDRGTTCCIEFYTEANLKKMIAYLKSKLQNYPTCKGQKVGMYADMLLKRLKYEVFGYEALSLPFLESPIIVDVNKPDELSEADKIAWNDYLTQVEEQELVYKTYDEASSACISLYNQYIFIYEILFLLRIIDKEEQSNKAKFHYMKDCLLAYRKIAQNEGGKKHK